ncbi:MAG: cupin domain-containing protein [Phycisphaerales bacterium]|nr:cupin domain-containing protein [Phycisphaerales bacterium]MCB9856458.1 cupin domain-containing protein [Phycisphaerales bacterium]
MNVDFPDFVRALPKVAMPIEGLHGWVLKGEQAAVMFMEADADVVVPAHRHGAQWGCVIDGTMTLTMLGETRSYQRGESHTIPAGVEHEAKLRKGWKGFYVFPRATTE